MSPGADAESHVPDASDVQQAQLDTAVHTSETLVAGPRSEVTQLDDVGHACGTDTPLIQQTCVQKVVQQGVNHFIHHPALTKHMMQHCAICGQWVASQKVMKLHYRNTHKEAEPTWQLGFVPLRMVLANSLIREVIDRLNKVLASQEKLQRAKELGWRDEKGWRFQVWNPTLRHLEADRRRPPIPDDKLLDHLATVVQCLKAPIISTRRMSETMTNQATFKMDISLRSHSALTMWDTMRTLQGNTVFQLVGMGYKTEPLGRGPEEQKIRQAVYGRAIAYHGRGYQMHRSELMRLRLKILTSFFKLIVHVMLVLVLFFTFDLFFAPCLQSATWWVIGVLGYLLMFGLLSTKRPLASSLLVPLRLLLWVRLLLLVWVSGTDQSQSGVLGRHGLCQGSHILQTLLFPLGGMTILQTVSYFAVDTWVKGQIFGPNPWLIMSACAQSFAYLAIPLFFEFAVREWIAASFQSQDSDSLIAGFRQMLKGICDGELLLDGNFQICGTAPCLQRLLSSSEDFAGRSFPDLLADDDARKLLNDFLAPAAATSDADEGAESGKRLPSTEGAAPRCLRVPLRAPSGQAISVDVFHVSLPSTLYGESTSYHLLALKQDVDSMPPPEVDPTQNVLPSSLLASRRPPSVRSAASNESYEECYDELAELTLLVNASTPLMDIEEAHLRFVRKTNKSKVRMGMPTLKRRDVGATVPMAVERQSFEEPRVRPPPSLTSLDEEVGFEGPVPSPMSRPGHADEDKCPPSPDLTGQEARVDLEHGRQERGPSSEESRRL
ncbi:hypothetical protein AK812_SmicGene38583 [Symbiodinium microadriaticum]|uniref:C2H2-type domain-containing protein n=1 Tax=Symbiodinium microadriaticum TaxID=2951 RepID=A0A1Q9CDM2_SYMMI|nr:hypothetical protein AK812_SmicGene38583 [Symbiodinium microadriaticum]